MVQWCPMPDTVKMYWENKSIYSFVKISKCHMFVKPCIPEGQICQLESYQQYMYFEVCPLFNAILVRFKKKFLDQDIWSLVLQKTQQIISKNEICRSQAKIPFGHLDYQKSGELLKLKSFVSQGLSKCTRFYLYIHEKDCF